MKKLLLLAFFLAPFVLVAQEKKAINLTDIWQTYQFYPASVSGFDFLNDGVHFTRLKGGPTMPASIVKYNIKTGDAVTTIFESTSDVKVEGYTFSDDEKKVLIATDVERIYRRSSRAMFYIFDVENKALNPLEKEKVMYATFNPTGSKVAFVQDNNLFYRDFETGERVRLTEDGKQNHIINGAADWVYEEEFSLTKAFAWSPDGTKIAYIRFDESAVPEFTMMYYYNKLYPKPYTFKYPKAGEKNAVVSVFIYDLNTNKTTPVKLGADKEQYVPRITWTPGGELCVTRLNRHQNKMDLILVDAENGQTRELLTEKDKRYVEVHDHLTFLKDKKHFITLSERDGYNHIYLMNMKGKVVKQLTRGKFDVTDFYGVDEANEMVFFQSAASSPMNREVCSVDFKGKKVKVLTQREGTESAQFSKTFDFYVSRYSSATHPPMYLVRNRKGKKVRTLEDNKRLYSRIEKYDMGQHEFFDFTTSEKVKLNGWMIKPSDFDAKKKYPVFMFVYGGPGSQEVLNQWDAFNYFWFNMLADQGYIVACVDGRGTGARGADFKKMTYQELGKLEAIDQIEAAKYLGQLNYVDAERIGIFGWSFGGYLSTLCLAKGADVFKMAIAVAPVTNWKWYDTIYTERYMRTPQENESGYEDNSPVNFAANIKGKYLLVHGLADDNVHFQHAAEMANALITNNIPFEQHFYPNKDHGIYGGLTRLHLYNKMTDFIQKNL